MLNNVSLFPKCYTIIINHLKLGNNDNIKNIS